MATTSNHNLQYPENDDQISAYPTTAAITAAIVDQALPIKGGSVGQVLAKSDDADYKYIWKDAPTGGGDPGSGDSYPGISQDVPNDLELRGDGLYVSPAWLNADDPDDRALAAAATAPVQLYGVGRPDQQYGALGTLSATATTTTATLTYADAGDGLAAPEGSVFTCTDSQGGNNFGAKVWRKGPSEWVCTEGDTGLRSVPAGWTGNGSFTEIKSDDGQNLPSGSCQSRPLAVRRIGPYTSVMFMWLNSEINPQQNHQYYVYYAADDPFLGISVRTGVAGIGAATADSGVGRQVPLSGGVTPGVMSFVVSENNTSGGTSNVHAAGLTEAPWPTNPPPLARAVIDELRELIEAAQDPDHPQHDQLQALKDELEQLHHSTGTGDIQ